VQKSVIDAKQALQDIRSGMSDSDLMEKYNLSPLGLESLIGKLVELGAIRQVSAKDLVRDIRSGVTNRQLMKKYKLNANALKKLFNEMTEAGISFFRDRQEARHKKRINVRQMVEDIRWGAAEAHLMEKHGLSSRGLQSAFWKLVRSGVLTWDELLNSYPGLDDTVTLQKMRQCPRGYPLLSIGIYEEGNPENRGWITDVSEKGMGVTGIHAQINERKSFVLVPDEFTEFKPLSLEAVCRWFNPKGEQGLCFAGFEITWIDVQSFTELQELLQSMTLVFE
jgi:uncharacterized protein (DUF433 family)